MTQGVLGGFKGLLMGSERSSGKVSAAAERLFQKQDAAVQAMTEYQAGVEARRKNTARLRELRLAKEATDKGEAEAGPKS